MSRNRGWWFGASYCDCCADGFSGTDGRSYPFVDGIVFPLYCREGFELQARNADMSQQENALDVSQPSVLARKLLRALFASLCAIDFILGVWLLFFPYHFLVFFRLPTVGETLFVRESGSYMLIACFLYALSFANPAKNIAACQTTILYRGGGSLIEYAAVFFWLAPGPFRTVFAICAVGDTFIAIATAVLLRKIGLPWNPLTR